MFGDRALVGALRAGEPYARSTQRFARVLVEPRADRLDEGQSRRLGDEFIAPQTGHQQHVGFADALLELVETAHLERIDAGIAQCELLAHAVGDVGEADAELVFGGKSAGGHAAELHERNVR